MTNFLDKGKNVKRNTGSRCVKPDTGIELMGVKAEGTMSFIIVPYTVTNSPYAEPGELFYLRDYWQYHLRHINGGTSVMDNYRTFKEKCAVAESLLDWEGPEKPKARQRILMNVFFPATGKLAVLEHSFATLWEPLFKDMQAKASKKKYEYIQHFCDPKEPTLIEITFEEVTKGQMKFFQAVSFDYDEADPIPKDVLERAANLDESLVKLSYAETKAILFQGTEDDDDDPDADEAPETPVKTKAKAEEPEEESLGFGKGDTVYDEDGREATVINIRDGVVKIEYTDDEDVAKVAADTLSTTKPKAKTKAPAKVVEEDEEVAAPPKKTKAKPAPKAEEESEMPWDSGDDWEDAE